MAPRRHPRSCRECGRPDTETGRISARGLCDECGDERQLANLYNLRAGAGPFHRNWQRKLVAALGGALVDDAPDKATPAP